MIGLHAHTRRRKEITTERNALSTTTTQHKHESFSNRLYDFPRKCRAKVKRHPESDWDKSLPSEVSSSIHQRVGRRVALTLVAVYASTTFATSPATPGPLSPSVGSYFTPLGVRGYPKTPYFRPALSVRTSPSVIHVPTFFRAHSVIGGRFDDAASVWVSARMDSTRRSPTPKYFAPRHIPMSGTRAVISCSIANDTINEGRGVPVRAASEPNALLYP